MTKAYLFSVPQLPLYSPSNWWWESVMASRSGLCFSAGTAQTLQTAAHISSRAWPRG